MDSCGSMMPRFLEYRFHLPAPNVPRRTLPIAEPKNGSFIPFRNGSPRLEKRASQPAQKRASQPVRKRGSQCEGKVVLGVCIIMSGIFMLGCRDGGDLMVMLEERDKVVGI